MANIYTGVSYTMKNDTEWCVLYIYIDIYIYIFKVLMQTYRKDVQTGDTKN